MVALESSIIAHGLPAPDNERAALACEEAISEAGGLPATIAILDGQLRVGLTRREISRLAAGGARKVSSRDLGPLLASEGDGATTVAATVRVAALAGIHFMATGGIGGVHRAKPEDQSADLEELARSPVAVFCAGAKIILDVAATLERLESLAVPVIGYACDEFPAFYVRRSGLPLEHRADDPEALARMLAAAWATGSRGVVVAIPPPQELPGAEEMVEHALRELGGVSGPDVTPRMLARIAELSGGRSVDVNVQLARKNAEVAAQAALEWCRL